MKRIPKPVIYIIAIMLMLLVLACESVPQKYIDECMANNPGWDARNYCEAQYRQSR